MSRIRMAAALGAVLALGATPPRADTIWDVESARANARAGGPISAYDAELLDRWGCLSGTRSAFCQHIRHGANSGWYHRAERARGRR
jgi:hypothetical protein